VPAASAGRRRAHRRGCGRCRDLVSRETVDGVGTAFRFSEPRAELLKGFERPVVVSVDWR